MANEQEVTRCGELRAGHEQARVGWDMRSQPAHQRSGVSAAGEPDMPALIEVGFRAEAAHGMRDIEREVAFVADLKELDLPHHTLPPPSNMSQQ